VSYRKNYAECRIEDCRHDLTRGPCPRHDYDPFRKNPWFSPPALQYVARFTGNPPVRENPWFSPPALQYVARFTGNPPNPQPFLEWGTKTKGHGLLDYTDGYSGPPGYAPPGQGPLFDQNPPFRAGDKVTWSEESLEMDLGRPGQVLTVVGPGLHRDDEDRTRIAFSSGRQRLVNNWAIVHLPALRHTSPGRIVDTGPEPRRIVDTGATHRRVDPAELARRLGAEGASDKDDPLYFTNPDVLCQCGWGRLGMPEGEIPDYCPVCSYAIGICEGCGERRSDCECGEFSENPQYFSRRAGVARPYSRGSLHRTMETDPMQRSRMKGMLAFYGKSYFGLELTGRQIESMLGKSPKDLGSRKATAKHSVKKHSVKVGARQIQVGPIRKGQKVKLADVKRRVDAIFYAQARGLKALPGVSISEDTVPAPARRRRGKRAVGTLTYKKTKAKKKAKKKRKRANPPPAAKRCTSKKNDGKRCKGRKLPGKKTCVFHS
jgi:hypothetical protein